MGVEEAVRYLSRVGTGAVRVARIEVLAELDYQLPPSGLICLCDVESGAVAHRAAGWPEAVAFGPGELFSVGPPERASRGRAQPGRYGVTTLDPALLGESAGKAAGEPVPLLGHRPVGAEAASQLRAAIAYLRDEVLGVPGIGADHPVVSSASRYLAACVLAAFPHTAPAGGGPGESPTLCRAVAFMEAHAGGDIGAADIACAAGVSVRAVQLAFRRQLGTTPMAYLRRIRLDRARAELRAAGPGTTVAEVAARWGYARSSVFAARYRAAYGEPPSRTLRRD